jgi:hypothetical protein
VTPHNRVRETQEVLIIYQVSIGIIFRPGGGRFSCPIEILSPLGHSPRSGRRAHDDLQPRYGAFDRRRKTISTRWQRWRMAALERLDRTIDARSFAS